MVSVKLLREIPQGLLADMCGGNDPSLSHTIAGHDFTVAAVAQDRVDDLADRLGPYLLAAIWDAEFSFFLRHRECAHRDWFVAGKPADLFLGGMWAALFSNAIHHRSCGSAPPQSPHHRRNGIHVRSAPVADDSTPEFVSRGNAAVAAVGDLASWL